MYSIIHTYIHVYIPKPFPDLFLTLNSMVTDSEPVRNGNTLIMQKYDARLTKPNYYLIGIYSAAS